MINPRFTAKPSHSKARPPAQGNLLGLLIAIFYGIFTVLPNSSSVMVTWPWVFIWQVGLICPVLWLLGLLWQRRLRWLGNQLDWVAALLVVGLIMSAGLAQFPMQARWYSWATFCFLAALYALSTWLNTPDRRMQLLMAQGYLNLAFIGVSLALWGSQTLIPELNRLHEWKQAGVALPYDFAVVELRNWAPIGHQNYVAGYLVLALPLLLGLGSVQSGWRRWLWWGGSALGLVDLYTTSSRGGWLGILAIAIAGLGLLLWRSSLPRLWLGGLGILGIAALVLLALTNNRLRSLVFGGLAGQSGEVMYRIITAKTGWHMGGSHLWTGIGPGGVPLLYQQYRPLWAGRVAEWAYQLHSTPAQLWAEFGLWSIAFGLGTLGVLLHLAYTWLRSLKSSLTPSHILTGCLFGGLLGYGVVSLIDYQLDNICISGTIVLFLAVLTAEFRDRAVGKPVAIDEPEAVEVPDASPHPLTPLLLHPVPFLPLMGLGILIAATIWLIPIHRAWMLSSQGFTALNRNDPDTFTQRLSEAHQLASWEPYYAYQLGWNLGNLGLQTRDPQQQQQLLKDGITWLKQGVQSLPSQEFGYTNLGWLLLNQNPKAASQAFVRSAQLLPAKRGVLYGLGLSLLAQGQQALAIEAIALEGVRDPLLMTSPIWQLPELKPLYDGTKRRVEQLATDLLSQTSSTSYMATQLHQIRGGLRWWWGDFAGAHADLDTAGTDLSRLVLSLAEGKPVTSPITAPWVTALAPVDRGGPMLVAAWLDPAQRETLLQQAWILANRATPAPPVLQEFEATMARSATFDQWLKQNAPTQRYRTERLGFGVLSRHIDGPIPLDFLTVVDNSPIAQFLKQLVPSFEFAPDLDQALQSQRDALFQKVLP